MSALDHSEEEERAATMRELTNRLAREQNTSHERVLLETGLAGTSLATLGGDEICALRGDSQVERARHILSAATGAVKLDSESYHATLDESGLRLRFGDRALVWWQAQSVAPTAQERGIPNLHQVEVGEPMCARSQGSYVWGVYDGYDGEGRAYLRARHKYFSTTYVVPWADAFFLRPQGFAPERVPIIGTQSQTEVNGAVLDASLGQQALGDYSVQDFVSAIEREGYFVCTRGSAVRGALVQEPIKDVDMVTTAPMAEVRRIINETAPELGIGDARGSLGAKEAGIFRLLPKQLGMKTGAGFDVTGLKRWHWNTPTTPNELRDPHLRVARFGLNLEEDAWSTDWHINTLYAHRVDARWRLAEPIPGSAEDIRLKRLRETRCEKNPRLSLRFWKFRLRGFEADANTKQHMREHLERVARTDAGSLVWFVHAIAGSQLGTRAKLDAFLADLGRVMHADGAGDLFERYFAGEAFANALSYADSRQLIRESPGLEDDSPELW